MIRSATPRRYLPEGEEQDFSVLISSFLVEACGVRRAEDLSTCPSITRRMSETLIAAFEVAK